jgi:putative sterol carrier protein
MSTNERAFPKKIFHSDEHFYLVMHDVFSEVAEHPHMDAITRSNLVIRIKTTQPDAELLVDGRQPPLEVFYGTRPGKANIEIVLSADLLHRIWLGQVSTRESFFSGKIKTRGNMLKMMTLTDLFAECERVYPAVAKKHGLPM